MQAKGKLGPSIVNYSALMRQIIFLFFWCAIATVSAQSKDLDQAREYLAKSEFVRAERLGLQLEQQGQDAYLVNELLGDIYSAQKQWDKALKRYGTLLEVHADSANAHFKYGGALGMKALQVNRFKAITYVADIQEHFEQTVRLDPSHIPGRWALIEFYLQLPSILGGGYDKAQEQALTLAEVSPVDGLMAKARLAEHEEDWALAEKYYWRAVDRGQSIWTYQSLARFYENRKRYKEALAVSITASGRHQDARIDYQIGKLSVLSGAEFDQGLQAIQKFIKEFHSENGIPLEWGYYRLAQIQRLTGEVDKAYNAIQLALTYRPKFEQAIDEKDLIVKLKGI
ncbi:MAG: hypothetical protein ABR84_07400 [Cryomorphaceae bacterium BACL21 MAG-121220-bin10]|jgi:tetratricopeptide (TPR) repeat protein|nr:MAG: hypothetical protein ABR84_07400 [Cryomorphaceae bacterium BACL21 MAG-121220-bin10]|tara:strand:+ start:31818 stop:32840 length:1023 start_codon:yes stop_codon:yes gene_type:complete